MFGPFEEGNGMTTDVWSDRLKSRQDIDHHSIVARTLLSSASPPTAPSQERKKKAAPTSSSIAAPEQLETDYCDSYPNTNTNKIDWALLAAHRVGNVLGIKVNESKKVAIPEKNLAVIFFARPAGDRFKDDQRYRMIERLTLESILLAIFLPVEVPAHLGSLASQHAHLRLAARQCAALVEQNHQSLSARGSRERDLLIKRILFHADNGKTECTYVIDAKEFNQPSCTWSEQTLDSVREPDLFGRAIGVLVHDVLQSPSLRVRAGNLEKQHITLTLSWATALENIKIKEEEVPLDVVRKDDKEEFRTRDEKRPPPPPPPSTIHPRTSKVTSTEQHHGKTIAHPLEKPAEEETTVFF